MKETNFDGIIKDLRNKTIRWPSLPEGPGTLPHGMGRYWVRDGKVYWENGEIGDLSTGENVPCVGIQCETGEDFSLWTDEKRAEVVERRRLLREKANEEARIYYEKQDRLVASARAKLTEEEFEAVVESGQDY